MATLMQLASPLSVKDRGMFLRDIAARLETSPPSVWGGHPHRAGGATPLPQAGRAGRDPAHAEVPNSRRALAQADERYRRLGWAVFRAVLALGALAAIAMPPELCRRRVERRTVTVGTVLSWAAAS